MRVPLIPVAYMTTKILMKKKKSYQLGIQYKMVGFLVSKDN